ncbi:MAG: FUSC family protein [Burkholderiales bacterium]
MNPLSAIKNAFPAISLTEDDVRYGLQLSVSVAIAYLIPWVLNLPEGFWAVMSALIVMRSRTGSTLGEGWGRFKGTLAGTLAGLFGVWLFSLGMLTTSVTLGVIAAMAFVAGIVPALRSAPITALIILSSGGIVGQSAWQVAGLRIAEIAIGIGVSLAVTLLTAGSRSAAHFDRSIAGLLTDIGEQTRHALSGSGRAVDDKEEAGRQIKVRLGRLALLAASADTEHGLPMAKKNGSKVAQQYRRSARLVARIAQDAALFERVFDLAPELQADPVWNRVADAVPLALASVTTPREGQQNVLASLLSCLSVDTDASATTERLHRLLEAPVRLLAADIQLLLRLRQA